MKKWGVFATQKQGKNATNLLYSCRNRYFRNYITHFFSSLTLQFSH